MNRLAYAAILLVLLVTATLSQPGTASPRPHIVLFLADDLGWKDVGYHGSKIRTPNLDLLASQGVRLEQFYVQPVCSPTRSSFMTGRYPLRQGLQVGVIRPWADYGLPLEERTLAQALQEVGYRTVITGKWHLGLHDSAYLPRQRGFDHQYGHYTGAIDYFTHERMGGLDWHQNEKALREEGYTTNLIAREAARIIEEHDFTQPLFLYVPFNAPHTPLQAPEEYLDRYRHIRDSKRQKFAAMVTCMDDAIGRILNALQRRGVNQNTLILFSSDNGGPIRNGANNGPLRDGKGSLYEGGVRVPALAVWPGQLEAGRIVNEPLHPVDWYPMLLRLAGASLDQPLPLDGHDAWPTIAEGQPSPRQEILHNVEPARGALRQGQWKLVVHWREAGGAPQLELFNLTEDPYERNNLAQKHPETTQKLLARLEEYQREAVPAKISGRERPADWTAPKVW